MSAERGRTRTWVDNHFMDTFQLWWMLRSAGKSIYFGVLFSALMVGAASIFRQSTDAQGILERSHRGQIMASFLIDNISVYIITSVAFSIGLTVSTWDATIHPIRKNFKQYLNYGMLSIAMSLVLLFIWIQVTPLLAGYNAAINVYVPMAWVNLMVAAMFGLSQTWRSYYVYSVLNSKARKEFTNKRQGDGPIKSTLIWFFPLPGIRDKSRLVGGLVLGFLVVSCGLVVGSRVQSLAGGNYIANVIAFTVALSLSSAVLGLLIRLWNSIKPTKKRDSLFPHWERKQGYVKINPDLEA